MGRWDGLSLHLIGYILLRTHPCLPYSRSVTNHTCRNFGSVTSGQWFVESLARCWGVVSCSGLCLHRANCAGCGFPEGKSHSA